MTAASSRQEWYRELLADFEEHPRGRQREIWVLRFLIALRLP